MAEQVRPGVYGVFYYDGGQTRKMFDALFACLPAVSAGGLAWVDRNQYMLYISKDGEIVNTRIRTATFFLRMSDATVALLCIDDRDKAILKYIRGWKQISGKTTPLLEDVPESQSFQASIYANTSREGLISDTLLDKYGPAIAETELRGWTLMAHSPVRRRACCHLATDRIRFLTHKSTTPLLSGKNTMGMITRFSHMTARHQAVSTMSMTICFRKSPEQTLYGRVGRK